MECKTPKAVLLLACESEIGPMRFISDDAEFPGIVLDINASIPIEDQLRKAAVARVDNHVFSRHVNIFLEYSDTVLLRDGTSATIFLAVIPAYHRCARPTWPTMPDMLRGMPKNRNRLPYLRSWQVLSGGLSETTTAIEAEELIRLLDKE